MNPLSSNIGQNIEGYVKAKEYFQQENLKPPYVPEDEKSKIVPLQSNVFGSKINPQSIYDIEAYINELLTQPVDNYVIFGFAGHGVKSRAMHYYTVKEHLALFVQLGYGGSSQESANRDRIEGIFHGIKLLFQSIDQANKNGLIEKGKRLLIIDSDFYGHGWGWIEGTPQKIDENIWHPDEPTLMNALMDIPSKE